MANNGCKQAPEGEEVIKRAILSIGPSPALCMHTGEGGREKKRKRRKHPHTEAWRSGATDKVRRVMAKCRGHRPLMSETASVPPQHRVPHPQSASELWLCHFAEDNLCSAQNLIFKVNNVERYAYIIFPYQNNFHFILSFLGDSTTVSIARTLLCALRTDR